MCENHPRLLVASDNEGPVLYDYGGSMGVQLAVMVKNYNNASPTYEAFTMNDGQYECLNILSTNGIKAYTAADIATRIREMVEKEVAPYHFDMKCGTGEDIESLAHQIAMVEFYNGKKMIVGFKVHIYNPAMILMPSTVLTMHDDSGDLETFRGNYEAMLAANVANELMAYFA